MTDPAHPTDDAWPAGATPAHTSASCLRRLLRRDGGPMLATAGVTLAVEAAAYLASRAGAGDAPGGMGAARTALMTLAAMTLWVSLASPVVAAGGRTALSSFLRTAAVSDASGAALLALAALSPFVTLAAAVKIYLVLTAVALAGTALVCCGRRSVTRFALAVTGACAVFAALSCLFWVDAIAGLVGGHGAAVTEAALSANPFYSVLSAIVRETGFVWHGGGTLMYESITRVGQDVPVAAVPWWAAVWRYAVAAGGLGVVAAIRRR